MTPSVPARFLRTLAPPAAALAAMIAASCGPAPASPALSSPVPMSASPTSLPTDPPAAAPAPAPAPKAPAAAARPAPLPGTEGLFAEAVRRGLPPGGLLLVADTGAGIASLVSKAGPLFSFPMSGSRFGLGSKSGSNRTPPGWHRVAERFGAGAAPGTMFVSRRATGRVLPPSGWRAPDPAEDAVLTRILWLEGLEPGVNRGPGVDSRDRCIYLHGTNQEQLLGQPASHGCLRFSNADIVRLFDFTEGAELYCFIR